MSPRFSLRFESGERAGEVVPISGAAFTVGRKPGNSLQLVDASVSGKHAEFTITDAGVHLRDLGSTNGTKVGGERVTEAELAAGSSVHLGQVALTFLDAEVGAKGPAPAPVAEEAAQWEASAEPALSLLAARCLERMSRDLGNNDPPSAPPSATRCAR